MNEMGFDWNNLGRNGQGIDNPKEICIKLRNEGLSYEGTQEMVTSSLWKKKHQQTRKYQWIVQCDEPLTHAGAKLQSLWKGETCTRKMLELASLHCLWFYQSRSSQMLEHRNIKASHTSTMCLDICARMEESYFDAESILQDEIL